jgi:polysaccharide chain length determinant protein (PEP-CTERM system associated)
MKEQTEKVAQIVRAVWGRRWLAIAVAWVVACLGCAAVWFTPDRYQSAAKLYVDTQSVLKPLMAGLAFQPDLDQQVRMLARTLISRPNIERLVDAPELGLTASSPVKREALIDDLMKKIKVEPSGSGNLYVLSYRDTDAHRSQKLMERLVEMFVDSGADSKRRDSEDASRFIDQQIKNYEAKLVEAENRLKDFKLRNFGFSGTSDQDYFARMSALAEQVNKLKLDLSAVEQAREALKRELASEDPQMPASALAAAQPAPAPSELDTRIDGQRRQLDELLRRYTDEHPDVVAVRRTLGQLEAQRKAELEARAKAGNGKTVGYAATNPVYQRLRISLAEAEAQAASLRTQLNTQQSRLDQVRAQASRVPQVEAELAQLNRDYDVIRRNYDLLVGRREAAALGVKIDQSSQMAEFRIVEPARVAGAPVFPGRFILGLLVIVGSIAAGVGAAYAASVMRPVIASVRELGDFSKRPVLGSLTVVVTDKSRAASRQDLVRVAGAVGVLLVGQIAWLLLIIKQAAA